MWRRGRNVWEVWGRGRRREEVGARRPRWRSRGAEPSGPKSTLNSLYWASTKHTHISDTHTFPLPLVVRNNTAAYWLAEGCETGCVRRRDRVKGWKSKCSLLVLLRCIFQMEISEWQQRWFVGERWPFEQLSVQSRVISCGLVCGGGWILQLLPDSHHEAAAGNGSRSRSRSLSFSFHEVRREAGPRGGRPWWRCSVWEDTARVLDPCKLGRKQQM